MTDNIARLRGRLLQAIADYERAKRRFADVTDAYCRIPGIDPVDAEHRAASDPRRRKAGDDCAWHGAEIQRYAAALTALAVSTPDPDMMALAHAAGVTPTHLEAVR